MASVKIKFRASSVAGGKGVIFYQVIHCRVVRQIRTGYRIFECEWDGDSGEVVPSSDDERLSYIYKVKEGVANDVHRLERIIAALDVRGWPYVADEVVAAFAGGQSMNMFFVFMEEVIMSRRNLGKARTAETYAAALSSFRRFMNGNDVVMNNMDSDMMLRYEAWLREKGVRPNTSSFYMRNLRAVYNRAVEKELTVQRFPFRHVYTGVERTVKRAIPINIIRKLKEMELADSPALDFARDMFMFSFYTRGMSFVDMAYLRRRDLAGGMLSYRRRKTGQRLVVKWEGCMEEIVAKYGAGEGWLLPIVGRGGVGRDGDVGGGGRGASGVGRRARGCGAGSRDGRCGTEAEDERRRYILMSHNVNRNLKIIGRRLRLAAPLTMYVARHAWASIAKSRNVPMSVISEGMGHDSENTTRIYLASLDNVAIDKANSMILKLL